MWARIASSMCPRRSRAHFGLSDSNTALFAHIPTIFHAFVFTAQTFVVFDGSKDLGAKKTIALGLKVL